MAGLIFHAEGESTVRCSARQRKTAHGERRFDAFSCVSCRGRCFVGAYAM